MAADLDSARFIIDPVSGGILGISAGGARAYFGGANADYTAAELTALAAAGGLTPYVTYIASDDPYPQLALDASTLGSPLGGNYVTVQVAGAGGGTVEI